MPIEVKRFSAQDVSDFAHYGIEPSDANGPWMFYADHTAAMDELRDRLHSLGDQNTKRQKQLDLALDEIKYLKQNSVTLSKQIKW